MTNRTEQESVESVTLLEAIDITQRFGGVTAVDNVNMIVRAGTVHGLIGPNGAGKTTFFDCVAGTQRPVSGRILLDGKDITARSAVQRARLGVRRTFQRQQVFGWLSVEDNVLLGLEWHGGGGGMVGDLLRLPTRVRRERQRRERADEVLAKCGLLEVREEPAGNLPIGQLRRVELARAIVDSPRLLLLDEPTSGLEDHEIEQMGEIILALKESGECGVLLIEHHIPFVMKYSDEVTVLELGRVIAHDVPDEIMQNAAVRDSYLT